MPGTLRDPGYGVRPAKDNSPAELERVGKDYLAAMGKRYDGNVPLQLAAYNAGPATVDNYGGVPPYPETMEYLRRVLRFRQEYLHQNLRTLASARAFTSRAWSR